MTAGGRAAWSYRLRLTALGAALSYAVLAQTPEPTEDHVRAALVRASDGALGIEDFVWLPSRGRLTDALEGRDVVFVARAAERTGVYRARVHLTLGGFPVIAEDLEEVLPTRLADEGALVARGDRFAYVVERGGATQSVVLGSQADAARVHALTLEAPRGAAAIGLGADILRVVSGSFGVDVSLSDPHASGLVELSARADEGRAGTKLERGAAEGATRFEGLEARRAWGGEHPAIAGRTEPGGEVLFVDGRQTLVTLLPGWRGLSDTGYRPRVPLAESDAARGELLAAIELPGLAGGGAVHDALLTTPSDGDAGLFSAEGILHVGTYEGSRTLRAPADAFLAPLAWNSGAATTVCATTDGHLVFASAEDAATSARLAPTSCDAAVVVPGEARLAPDPRALLDLREHATFFVFGVDVRPKVGAELGLAFEPVGPCSAEPTFIPSIFAATTEALGATVTVHHVDASRFDFRVIVGSTEKSHRLGGKFEVGVPERLAPAFRFHLPVGVGKRQRPRGLRSLGNLGHALSLNEGLLELGDGVVRVATGREETSCGDGAACPTDATELPLSVRDGAPTDVSRHRGPFQSRADVCVLGGALLVATSEFDTHEANATVLAQLGCARAVSLDRGSEHPSRWAGSELPGEVTSVAAFDRPLRGRVVAASVQR